jgi:hypothetical protein
MEWRLDDSVRIFRRPEPRLLLAEDSIEEEMGFITKPQQSKLALFSRLQTLDISVSSGTNFYYSH